MTESPIGPTLEKPDQVIDSIGTTTSYRMGAYSLTLIVMGQTGMIGKGKRNTEVIRRLEVEDLPVIVVIDSEDNNLYESGQGAYLSRIK